MPIAAELSELVPLKLLHYLLFQDLNIFVINSIVIGKIYILIYIKI